MHRPQRHRDPPLVMILRKDGVEVANLRPSQPATATTATAAAVSPFPTSNVEPDLSGHGARMGGVSMSPKRSSNAKTGAETLVMMRPTVLRDLLFPRQLEGLDNEEFADEDPLFEVVLHLYKNHRPPKQQPQQPKAVAAISAVLHAAAAAVNADVAPAHTPDGAQGRQQQQQQGKVLPTPFTTGSQTPGMGGYASSSSSSPPSPSPSPTRHQEREVRMTGSRSSTGFSLSPISTLRHSPSRTGGERHHHTHQTPRRRYRGVSAAVAVRERSPAPSGRNYSLGSDTPPPCLCSWQRAARPAPPGLRRRPASQQQHLPHPVRLRHSYHGDGTEVCQLLLQYGSGAQRHPAQHPAAETISGAARRIGRIGATSM